MLSPLDILRDCTQRLEALGVEYMLTGSMALLYYAKPRFTNDLDIVVALRREDAGPLVAAFEDDYYIAREAVAQALARRSLFNVIHFESVVKVDLIIAKASEFHRHAFARRVRGSYGGFSVWVVQSDDLILAKLLWAKPSHSEVQLRDVRNLLEAGYDADYLNHWRWYAAPRWTF